MYFIYKLEFKTLFFLKKGIELLEESTVDSLLKMMDKCFKHSNLIGWLMQNAGNKKNLHGFYVEKNAYHLMNIVEWYLNKIGYSGMHATR